MGHKVTLRHKDGETETLAKYPDHDEAEAHVANYCRWDDEEWEIDSSRQRAECNDGRELTITPAPIYTRYDPEYVDTDPRSGWFDWHDANHKELASLDLLTPDGVLAVVLPSSDLDAYLDDHKRREVDPPEYYSRFPDDDRELLFEGPPKDDDREGSGIAAGLVENAIRMMNGKGRYSSSEHVLHDCLPMPCVLEREGHGAVVIVPRIIVSDDGGDNE